MGPRWHCGHGSSAILGAGSAHLQQTKAEIKEDQKTREKKEGEGEGGSFSLEFVV